MREHTNFLRRSSEKACDDIHRSKLANAIASYDQAVREMKGYQFFAWKEARKAASLVKDYVLKRLPELLEEFEANATKNGIKVLWASSAEEARKLVLEITSRHSVRKAVKSKSMTTEEIGLNHALEQAGVEVWETDLGELIVQLAGEAPYHIVTPAMHKTRHEISALFSEKLGSEPSEDPEVLTAIARKHLREAFCTADLGISGANFLLADIGAIALTENEGNARLSVSCPQVHIAIAGIEKVLPSLFDLELFLPLLATSGTGQQVSCYNSIIRGSRTKEENDGPEHMYVILLDNGRSTLYSQEHFRSALRCIRCGACLNACPVYKTIGGHAYGTTYQGPIGSVITPHLRGMPGWQHLSTASSLCGACSDVCPVCIELHHLLLKNRYQAYEQRATSLFWRWGLCIWAAVVEKRRRLNLLRPAMRLAMPLAKLLPRQLRTRIPPLPRKSFYDLWKEHESKKTHT